MAIFIEMEDLKIIKGFTTVNNAVASNGKVLQGGKDTLSVATYTFSDQSGVYELDLSYFDENDGEGTVQIYVNEKLVHGFQLDKDLGSANANKSTLTNEIVKMELRSGDVIRFEGQRDANEGLRLDSLTLNRIGALPQQDQPAPEPTPDYSGVTTHIEAENMSYKGFIEKSSGAASGGKYIQAQENNATVSTTFEGNSGVHDLVLNYFDENDGVSEMTLRIDGQVVETWSWDKDLGSNLANSKTLTSKTFKNIELNKGAEIEFIGTKDGGEPMRVDSFDLIRTGNLPQQDQPQPEPTPDYSGEVISVEAEHMNSNGFVQKSSGAASGDAYMQAQNNSASLSTDYDGPSGTHDLVINYFDENDGVSEMTLKVDGQIIDTWSWSQNLGSNLANSKTLTSRTFENVELQAGSKIELIGTKDGGEPMRVDSMDIVLNGSGEGPSQPQPDPDPQPPTGGDGPSTPPPTDSSGLKAFAGAEGFGADAVGGRGGEVIHVTNLKNSGNGSLRWALEDVSGPRIVVFDVEGQINLTDEIKITDPYVTLAGQTAPGDGVVLSGARIKIAAHDVIMRGMKIRPGDDPNGDTGENRDSLSISDGAENVIVDHNSFTWAADETLAIWGHTKDITVSNNIIGEALYDSIHWKGPHGMGLLIGNKPGELNSENITVAKNLLVSNNGRNPFIKQVVEVEFVNNYVSNYGQGHNGLHLGGSNTPVEIAMKGNYYEDGKDTGGGDGLPPLNLKSLSSGSEVYLEDNYLEGHKDNESYGKTQMIVNNETFTSSNVAVLDSSDVKDYVLNNVGARVNGELDVVDSRIIQETKAGTTRIIDSQDEVGGYDGYNFNGDKVKDSDGDGMADWFENKFAEYGFNVNKADDNKDYDGDGYTNIEEYINGLISGFDFGPQGGIYGTNGTDSFKIPSNATGPVHLYDFNENKDYLDISDVLTRKPSDIDEAISDFVKTTYNNSKDQVSVYVDADGARNGADMKLVAIIENADQADIIDVTNLII